MRVHHSLKFAVFALTVAAEAHAATPLLTAENPLVKVLSANISAEEYLARALRPFDEFMGGEDTLTAARLEDDRVRRLAALRASALSDVMRFDLNADLRVTVAEMLGGIRVPPAQRSFNMMRRPETPAAELEKANRLRSDRLIEQYDANHDGAIDVRETYNGVKDSPDSRIAMLEGLMAFAGKSGKITRPDIKTLAQQTFDAADSDRNGRLSQDEYAAVRELKR